MRRLIGDWGGTARAGTKSRTYVVVSRCACPPDHETDLTRKSCHYTPIFGEGDVESRLPQSVGRFGELTVRYVAM
jgi:hypothetical protein